MMIISETFRVRIRSQIKSLTTNILQVGPITVRPKTVYECHAIVSSLSQLLEMLFQLKPQKIARSMLEMYGIPATTLWVAVRCPYPFARIASIACTLMQNHCLYHHPYPSDPIPLQILENR